MNKLKLKLVTGFTLLIFSINAFAIFPLIFAAYPAVLTAIEGMTAMDMAVTGSVAIHAAALAVTFKGNGAPSGGYSVVLDPNTPLITPQGWQNPTTPPVSVPADTNWTDGTHTATSLDALGALYAAADTAANASCNCQYLTTYVSSSIVSPTDALMTVASSRDIFPVPSNSSFYVHATQSCRAGYTRNNATSLCDVNDPSSVQKPADNVCQSRVLNGSIVNDVRDPDCAIADLNAAGFSQPSPDTVVVQPKGGTTKDTVKVKPDGSSTVTKETLTPDGNTDVKVVDIGAPDGTNPPQVTGISDTVTKGQGTLVSPTNASGQLDISGLNKEPTQKSIDTTLKSIDDKLKTDGLDNSLQTGKDQFNSEADTHNNDIKAIGDNGLDAHGINWTWFPSIPNSSCIPLTGTFGGHTVTIDHCETISKVRDILAYIFYILTAIGLFTIFTGRKE